jgi:hypothetical protein
MRQLLHCSDFVVHVPVKHFECECICVCRYSLHWLSSIITYVSEHCALLFISDFCRVIQK